MNYIIATLTLLIMAVSYRSKGAEHPWGTQANRFISWAVPVAFVGDLIAHIHNYPVWVGLASGLCAFATAWIGHSSFQDDNRASNIKMGIYCSGLLAAILLPFIIVHPAWVLLVPFGLLGGIGYYIGYRIPFSFWLMKAGDTSWGELLTGLLAFGLPMALLSIL